MTLKQLTLKQLTLAAIAIAMTATQALAIELPPEKADRNGDYFNNHAPVQGKVIGRGNMAGSLWQVVASGLNCRSDAGMQSPVVRSFSRGTVLQANVGRGGSDEVVINGKDKQGKPWMRVRSEAGESYECAVRANSRYIKPYLDR
jgi:hypothetical protein